MEEITEQLRAAAELPPEQAIEQIQLLWQQIDVAEGLAEAKMRVALLKLKPPKLHPLWSKATEQLKTISENILAHEDIIEEVTLLLRAFPFGEPSLTLPNIYSGEIEVNWTTENVSLTWLIGRSRIRWPGVNVRAYIRSRADGPYIKPFHQAFACIAHARKLLEQV